MTTEREVAESGSGGVRESLRHSVASGAQASHRPAYRSQRPANIASGAPASPSSATPASRSLAGSTTVP